MNLHVLSVLALAVTINAATTCDENDCARQITGTYQGVHTQTARRDDCSSFFQITVVPPTSAYSAITIRPSSIPEYASFCPGTSKYSSACSCFGLSVITSYATTTTSTTVITISTTSSGISLPTSTTQPTNCFALSVKDSPDYIVEKGDNLDIEDADTLPAKRLPAGKFFIDSANHLVTSDSRLVVRTNHVPVKASLIMVQYENPNIDHIFPPLSCSTASPTLGGKLSCRAMGGYSDFALCDRDSGTGIHQLQITYEDAKSPNCEAITLEAIPANSCGSHACTPAVVTSNDGRAIPFTVLEGEEVVLDDIMMIQAPGLCPGRTYRFTLGDVISKSNDGSELICQIKEAIGTSGTFDFTGPAKSITEVLTYQLICRGQGDMPAQTGTVQLLAFTATPIHNYYNYL